MTKFYVNVQGKYLGGFDGAEPPAGAIEVAEAPTDGRHVWNGTAWAEVKTMAEEIAACGAQFKSDMNILQLRWLAAAVANGTSAAAKKLAVEEDIVEVKAQYALDIAEIKSRYI